jgi:hypothetical protein
MGLQPSVLLVAVVIYAFAAAAVGWDSVSELRGFWRAAVLVLAALLVTASVGTVIVLTQSGEDTNWRVLAEYGRRAGTPALYVFQAEGPYHYSPLYAWLLVPLGWLGHWGFTALHLAVLPLFGNRRIVALMLVSWPFWFDAISGNVLTFVVLTAWWALKGNRVAIFAYLALCLLMPRPLMLPVAIWLLWKHAEWRLPFAGMVAINAVLVLMTGLADDWIPALFAATDTWQHKLNFGPSRLIGPAWLIVGIPLAAFLTWRGRLGLASLAVSPYLLPTYWLFAILESRGSGAAYRQTVPPPTQENPRGKRTMAGVNGTVGTLHRSNVAASPKV